MVRAERQGSSRIGAPLGEKFAGAAAAYGTTRLITKDNGEAVGMGIAVPILWEGLDAFHRIKAKEKRSVLRKAADVAVVGVAIGTGALLARDFVFAMGDVKDITRRAANTIQKGVKLPVGKDKQVEVPAWAIGAAGGAAGGAIVDVLRHGEKERNETSLKEAPQEAEVIRTLFDAKQQERVTIQLNGQPVEVNGAQALAKEYATRSLQEMLDQPGLDRHQKAQIRKAIDDVRDMVRKANDPANPDVAAQKSLDLIARDAFERIFLGKEAFETAAKVASRPQDKFVEAAREIPEEILKLHQRRPFKWIPLGPLEGILADLAGERELTNGNLPIDPRMLVNTGKKETLQQVQAVIEDKFKEIIADELANDATGEDIRRVNELLPTGPKASATEKDGLVNRIIGFVMAEEKPQNASDIAQVAAVADAFQLRPDAVFSKDELMKSPSYVRNLPKRRGFRKTA